MHTRLVTLLVILCVAGPAFALWPAQGGRAATAGAVPQFAPAVYSSPINAGCVQLTPSVCRLHVDPFTIAVASPQRLAAFQLRANGALLYDFRTDISNPPVGNYTPSKVALDFAATCGRTYTVNLLARDGGDPNFLNAGQAENVVCPVGTYSEYLPLIRR